MLDEFKKIIGDENYSSFLRLISEIGPHSRTHRISVVIAAILRFALGRVSDDYEDDSLAEALVVLDEEPYSEGEENEVLLELIDEICQEVVISNYRVSARGEEYSIAENVLAEYARWYNMPWED